jgi:hypothetical protein
MTMIPKSPDRSALEQEQFLDILSREEALARFEAALFPRALPSESRKLAAALGAALAEDVTAPIDVPRSTGPVSTALPCAPRTLRRPARARPCASR